MPKIHENSTDPIFQCYNNNNNKQTFQNAKLTLKSRTGARGGYNQKHANHQTKKSSATV